MIFMVMISHLTKQVYDKTADTFLVKIGENSEFYDASALYKFNRGCMALDCTVILFGAVSLLKYTSLAVPELEAIMLTVVQFLRHTFRKTLAMIIMTYILFGMFSWFILCFYQYGFFNFQYALIRTCIVFLSGFIINEQTVFYSVESVENLIRYNGFGLTFGTFLIVNILIRQVMINIVAIFMHSDYHKAKL